MKHIIDSLQSVLKCPHLAQLKHVTLVCFSTATSALSRTWACLVGSLVFSSSGLFLAGMFLGLGLGGERGYRLGSCCWKLWL
jgi:hypothetical protein